MGEVARHGCWNQQTKLRALAQHLKTSYYVLGHFTAGSGSPWVFIAVALQLILVDQLPSLPVHIIHPVMIFASNVETVNPTVGPTLTPK